MLSMRIGLIILISMLPGFVAAAGAMERSSAEYSANTITETSEGTIKGVVYHTPDKERREMKIEGNKTTVIVRRDKKLIWMLMPGEKVYMQMGLGESRDKTDLSGYEIKRTKVGTEKLGGVMTTKSKVVAKKKDGSEFTGFWWTTKEGIVMKMDLQSVGRGDKGHVKMRLTDVKIGKQDPKLFEIPAGYTKMGMGMPSMKDLMGGEDDQQDAGQGESDDDNKDEGGGFGLKNIFNMLK